MRLTKFTDYGLRVLMYLAVAEDEWVPVTRVAEAHGISSQHVQKAAHALATQGWIEGRRGRQGGVRLACAPADVGVGDVIRSLEQGAPLVECLDAATNECRLSPSCVLRKALTSAHQAFYREANAFTLADLAKPAAPQRRLLAIA